MLDLQSFKKAVKVKFVQRYLDPNNKGKRKLLTDVFLGNHHAGNGTFHSNINLKSNGKRTELSPIRSVIIQVIKSDDCAAGVRFVYQEYDYRLNWMTRSPVFN